MSAPTAPPDRTQPDLTRIDLDRPPTMVQFGGYIAESAPNFARLVFLFDLRW